MKKYLNSLQTVLILILVLVLLYLTQCSKTDPVEPEVIVTIETKWDTVNVVQTEYVPKWRTKIVTEHDTIPADVDTMSILKDYYAKYYYTDTLDLDSLGNIIINDTISRNSIIFREINPNIYIPTTIIKRDSLISKNEFYYGFGLAGNQQQFSYIGGELFWRSKRKRVFGVGLGINQNLQPIGSLRLMWKIGK